MRLSYNGIRLLGLAALLASGPASASAQTVAHTVGAGSGVVLTSSANPSTFGQTVTLTAAVSPSAATGRVTFYDGTTVLGTSTLAGGQAALTTILLPSGKNALSAYYLGGGGYAPSMSTVLTQTVNAVAAAGFAGAVNYPLSAEPDKIAVGDFNGDGKADLAVTFGYGLQILIGNGDGTFQPALTDYGSYDGVAVGDFNGDGKADLALASANTVSVLLGNGDGTFQAALNYTAGSGLVSIAVADFNGDGNADLVAVSSVDDSGDNTVKVLLGNGDGTFQAALSYAAGNNPLSVAVGDFNKDGKADIVVANGLAYINGSYTTGAVSVLIGNGDGTFEPVVSYPAGSNPYAVVTADFNGDGNLDLALPNEGNDVTVLLGNGDGTFGALQNYGSGSAPQGIAVGDINGDGKLDIVVGASFANAAGIILGNGDGTFQSVVYYAAGVYPTQVAVADFNGYGRTDVAIGNVDVGTDASGSPSVSILLGLAPTAGPMPTSAVLRSSSNPIDATQSLTLTAQVSPSTATGAVTFLDGSTALGTGTLSGGSTTLTTSTLSTGSYSLTAAYTGSENYAASTSAVLTQTVSQAVTTTILSSSSNPSNAGRSVILRATVLPPSATGTVTFQDGSTALGTGTLSNGTTTLAVATLTAGSHSLTAVYGGDVNDDGSTSSAVTQTVYSARTTTSTTLATTLSPSTFGQNVTLTATVSPSTATGSVTFYDGLTVLETEPLSGGQAKLKTTLLPSGTQSIMAYYSGDSSNSPSISTTLSQVVNSVAGNGFGSAMIVGAGTDSDTVTVGDFNRDGKADLAVPNFNNGYVSIYLGNGDGTFQPAVNYGAGYYPNQAAVGDFDGDGYSDLAVAYAGSNNVTVLLGNGDGTFQQPVEYPAGGTNGSGPNSVAVGDFNGDGYADIVAVSQNSVVSVYLGKGDGTFAAAVNYGSALDYNTGFYLAIGDFNGDGKADPAIVGNSALSIFLGNGDGTFQPTAAYSTAIGYGGPLVAADFNGDGKADLAIPVGGAVTVYLGNGNGTFQSPVNYGSFQNAYSVTSGDFNGDGRVDLAVSSFVQAGTVNVLLGNGDGTFQPAVSFLDGTASSYGIAAGQFDGDGRTDLVVTNVNNVTVLLNGVAATNSVLSTASPLSIAFGQSVPLTLTVSDSTAAFFAPTGTATFLDGTTVLGAATQTGSPYTFSASSLSLGSHTLTATYGGDAGSTGSTSNSITIQVNAAGATSQTITFGPLSDEALGSSPPALSASASSGLPVIFTSNTPAVCTVSGTTVTLVSFGTCSITASQEGNSTYASASATQTFTVVGSVLSVPTEGGSPSIGGPGNQYLYMAWSSTSSFTNVSISAWVYGSELTAYLTTQIGPGATSATLVASTTVASASSNQETLFFSGLSLPAGTYYLVIASASANGGAWYNGTTPVVTAPGVTILSSPYAGSTNSESASEVPDPAYPPASTWGSYGDTLTFDVAVKAPQTVTFGPLSNRTFGLTPPALSASASSGLAVTFTSNTPGVCTVSGTTVTLASLGTCSIIASQPGNSVYSAATPATQTFTVSGLTSQTITFDAIPNKIFGVSPFPITAQASFGVPLSLVSNVHSVCKTAGGLVTPLSAGTCSLTASQGTDSPVTQSFSVSMANPSGTLTPSAGSPFSAGTEPVSIAVGDFNGDGIQDFAVANSGSNNVTVMLGNVSGGYTAATGSPFATGRGPNCVVVGDFNGDGILDLATANQGGNVTLLLGNGSGGFAPAVGSPFTVGSLNLSLVVGDFNGDGILDLAGTDYVNDAVWVLLGDGLGGFIPVAGSPFTVGTYPISLVAGDFNGDGILDLAISNQGGANVTVLLGNGLGGFTTAAGSPFAVGTNPYFVVVGDFNGDGIPDLAAANNYSNNVTVLLGNGSGGFTAAPGSPFGVGTAPRSLAVGDFNGDGFRDIAVADSSGNSLTVLLGNGSGSFIGAPGGVFAAGSFPVSVATADFNGDGIPDLATANLTGNNVTVLLGGKVSTGSALSTTASATITQGQPVPLSLAVSDTSAAFNAPTGTATFLDGTTVLGTASQSGPTYTFSTSSLSAGSHTLTATYGGDSRSLGSTSNSITIQVTAPTASCDLQQNGIIGVADVQLLINEALGLAPAVNDLSGDGVVNVADVQIETNAVLQLGCTAN